MLIRAYPYMLYMIGTVTEISYIPLNKNILKRTSRCVQIDIVDCASSRDVKLHLSLMYGKGRCEPISEYTALQTHYLAL